MIVALYSTLDPSANTWYVRGYGRRPCVHRIVGADDTGLRHVGITACGKRTDEMIGFGMEWRNLNSQRVRVCKRCWNDPSATTPIEAAADGLSEAGLDSAAMALHASRCHQGGCRRNDHWRTYRLDARLSVASYLDATGLAREVKHLRDENAQLNASARRESRQVEDGDR
jgi:hypothetical protein